MGHNKVTEVTKEHGYFESTKYQETKLYDPMGRVVASGTGNTKQEARENAYKDLREKKASK